jgi:hypothetical protein
VESKRATEPESVDHGRLVGVRVHLAYGREVHTAEETAVESFHDDRVALASYVVATERSASERGS